MMARRSVVVLLIGASLLTAFAWRRWTAFDASAGIPAPDRTPPLDVFLPIRTADLWARADALAREGRAFERIETFDRLSALEPRHAATWGFSVYTMAVEIAPFETDVGRRFAWYRRAFDRLERGILLTKNDRSLRELEVRLLLGRIADDRVVRLELSRRWKMDTAARAATIVRGLLAERPRDEDLLWLLFFAEQATAMRDLESFDLNAARAAMDRADAALAALLRPADGGHLDRARRFSAAWKALLAADDDRIDLASAVADRSALVLDLGTGDEERLLDLDRRMAGLFEDFLVRRFCEAIRDFDHDRALLLARRLAFRFTDRISPLLREIGSGEWIVLDGAIRADVAAGRATEGVTIDRWRVGASRIGEALRGTPERWRRAWKEAVGRRPGLHED